MESSPPLLDIIPQANPICPLNNLGAPTPHPHPPPPPIDPYFRSTSHLHKASLSTPYLHNHFLSRASLSRHIPNSQPPILIWVTNFVPTNQMEFGFISQAFALKFSLQSFNSMCYFYLNREQRQEICW